MSDLGIFCLDRGWFEHPSFAKERFTEREAFAWMIAAAVRRPRSVRVGGRPVALERGQFAFSQRFLGNRWQWSIGRVQRFLARLVDDGMLAIADDALNLITIRNYDKYQVTESAAPTSHAALPLESPPSHENARPLDVSVPPATICESGASQRERDSFLESQSRGGGDGSARDSLISPRAFELANEVMMLLDIDPKIVPPGWCGAPMWLQAGLNSGWRPEVVVIAVAKVRRGKNFQQPFSFRYLAKPIEREHQLWAEPNLPMTPIIVATQEPSRVQASDASDWRARNDAKHAALAKLRASVAADQDSESDGGSNLRVVSGAGYRRS